MIAAETVLTAVESAHAAQGATPATVAPLLAVTEAEAKEALAAGVKAGRLERYEDPDTRKSYVRPKAA